MLQRVDILKFIHGEPAIGRVDLIEDIRARLQGSDGNQKHILEIQ